MNNRKSVNRTERIIYFITILALLSALAYLYASQKNTTMHTELLNHQSQMLQDELKKLNEQIKQKEIEIDQVVHSKDIQLRRKQKQLRLELKKLKMQRKVIKKHLADIGVLKLEKEVDADKIIQLNKQVVALKNNLQRIQANIREVVQGKIDSAKQADSVILTYLKVKNKKLQSQLSEQQRQQAELDTKIKELEESRRQLASPLLRIEVFTDASKLRYSKLNHYVNISLAILPNPAKERKNKIIRVYHLVYKYANKKTQMKRKLITTIPYHKQNRLVKSVKYNHRKAFEKGIHVFEAEVDGYVLASKTIEVE